jgi:hypothetical protein
MRKTKTRNKISQFNVAATYINKNDDRVDSEKRFINESIDELIVFVFEIFKCSLFTGFKKDAVEWCIAYCHHR